MAAQRLVKMLLFVLLSLALVGFAIGCASDTTEPIENDTEGDTVDTEESTAVVRFSTWHPTGGRDVETVWKPMLAEIEERSNGRIETLDFFGGTLGAADEHFDIVADGMSDFGLFTATFTPGKFPLTDVLSMPVQVLGKDIAADIGYEMYEQILYQDFPDSVEVLQLNGCVSAFIWTVDLVEGIDDLAGKRIRSPGGLQTLMIESMGAVPVFMPLGDVYLALETGDIDGILTCPQLYQAFRLYEVTDYAIMGDFGCVSEGVAMNKNSYDTLPEDLRQIIIDVVRNPFKAVGGLTEEVIHDCIDDLVIEGVEIREFSDADLDILFDRFSNDVVKAWVERLEAEGLPAKEALLRYKAIIDRTEGAVFRAFPAEWEAEVDAYR